MWLGYLGVVLALIAAYLAAAGDELVQAVIFAGANLAALIAILVGIAVHRPARPVAWYLLAAGQAAYLVGNVYWYVAPAAAQRQTVFPSPAAEIFLLSYLLSALALLQLIRARRSGGDWSALLDALIVTVAVTSANFVLLVAPLLDASRLSRYGQVLAGVYPFLDMIILMLATRLFFGAGRTRGALVPLAGWAAALLVADTVYGLEQVRGVEADGDLAFYGYLVSFLFVGVAALHPTMRDVAAERERLHSAGRIRLMALAVCGLAVPVLVVQTVRHGQRIEPIVLSCASAVMFLLLMLRVSDLLAKIVAAGRREHGRLQRFLDAIPVGVDVRAADTGEPVYVNGVARRILGYDPGRYTSLDQLPNLYATGTGEPFPPERFPINKARQGHVASVDDIAVDRDAQRRHLRVVATPIRDGEQVQYVLTAFADITDEREMAEELRQLSVIDELTGVNNRRGFLLAARTEIASARQAHRAGVLLFIDLDGLKRINDTHGHRVGDEALRATARLLRANTRRRDVLGRIGGDEFCVLLTEAGTLADADLWAERLREQVARHNESVPQEQRLAVTVGATVFDHQTPGTVEDLIARADTAMYQAREQTNGQHQDGPVRIFGRHRMSRRHRPSGR
ncbi:GGDEF domain-containing protein [Catellatospora bangladeshensis]|uniref:Diguanylate cyclase n=1 Tax=Catellatospora bangladeshensis TaxID=310355 RepID=A0A8J3JE78_9ACTN|nr:sensor domain-containing diguanylate cyclase [Catellatospora bangladeshensis]GIF82806.1 hypothetical protein Cba03nite_41550 [Catellatospora bangladeshensis]